jgi:hypothetical protein
MMEPRSVASVVAGLVVVGAAAFGAATPARAESADEQAVRSCWESTAEERVRRGRDLIEVESAQELLTMTAGKPCREGMANVINACLETGDIEGDHYPCLGIAARICLASKWASSDMRRSACLEAEHDIWRDRLAEDVTALNARLNEEEKTARESIWKNHIRLRDAMCALFRRVFAESAPLAQYQTCMLHNLARHAIDIRDTLAEVSGSISEVEPVPAVRGPDSPAPTRVAEGEKKAPVWGALAFTANGSYSSAWGQATKAEAEADVVKKCAKFGDGKCEVIAFEGRFCAALATHRSRTLRVSYTGGGTSVAAAQRSVMEQCRADRRVRGRCALRTVLCGDGR